MILLTLLTRVSERRYPCYCYSYDYFLLFSFLD